MRVRSTVIKKIGLIVFTCLIMITSTACAQNVGINATGAAPNSKALLDIDATGMTTKGGLLVPRLTTIERNAITAPIPESLLIYNLTTQCFEAWNQTVGIWVPFGCIGGCNTPTATVANASTGVAQSSLTVNWSAVSGATSYLLDVSTSSTFTSYISGYNNLNVGNIVNTDLTSLTCGTTYYYRIRANNACGIGSNSNTITVTTSACPIPTVSCGSQIWSLANLDVGTMINSINTGTTHSDQTNNGIIEKYCYNNVAANCSTYGGLYEWGEAMDYTGTINCDPCGSSGRQGICPSGYHIPTDLEWSRYEYCLESTIPSVGGVSLNTFQTTTAWRGTSTGYKLKVTSSNIPSWDGTNASGFSALPAGYRSSNGSFSGIGSWIFFWTATESSATDSWAHALTNISQSGRSANLKSNGMSVRCLKN